MNNYCEFNDVYYIIDKIQLTDVEEKAAIETTRI